MSTTGMSRKKKTLIGTGTAVAGFALTAGAVLLGGLGGAATVDVHTTAPVQCPGNVLSASLKADPNGDGAGHLGAQLELTNGGSSTCTVSGYPGLKLEKGAQQLPTTVVHAPGASQIVTLNPGATATASLTWSDVASAGEPSNGPCEATADSLVVFLPGGTEVADWNLGPVCDHGNITVSPFRG